MVANPKERLNAEKWIRTFYRGSKDGERIATSMLAALGPTSWKARPIHEEGRPPRPLLMALVEVILDAKDTLRMVHGPTKKVNQKQLNSVRSKARALAASLRDLPPGVRYAMAQAARIEAIDEDLLPKLDMLSEEARQWLRGERTQVPFTLRSLKSSVENALGYALALHGVEVFANREMGVLRDVLVLGYRELGIRAGIDPMRTMIRLKATWTPDTVRAHAAQMRPKWEKHVAWVKQLPPRLSPTRR